MSQPRKRRLPSPLLLAGLLSVLLVAHAQDAGTTLYAATDQVPLAAEAGGEPFATLYITSAVSVLEQDGDAARVRVEGMARSAQLEGDEVEVFTDATNATRVADVSDAAALAVEGEEGDWSRVALEGWVAAEALTDDLEPLFTRASEVYAANCTRCHAGYAQPVEVLRRTLPNARVERTIVNMARGTGVSDEDVQLLVHWFQHDEESEAP